MSADPFVQFPESGQSLNRYSYVMNNPLSLTDPSGFFVRKLFRNKLVRFVAAIALSAVTYGIVNSAIIHGAIVAAAGGPIAVGTLGTIATIGAGAAAGFVGDFVVSGGNLSAALQGGIVGGLSGFIGASGVLTTRAAKAVAHGVVGGVQSAVNGGKFLRGIASSFFTKRFASRGIARHTPGNPVGGAIVNAVVGGTASVIGGGKFANGATSAAFAQLFGSDGARQQSSGGGLVRGALDLVGKIWNLPNTIIGNVIGGVGHVVGEIGSVFGLYEPEPTLGFDHNAIEFKNNPFMASGGAITLGNSIIYGSEAYEHAPHEIIHTYQGQFLGPLYLPSNILGMAASVLSYPISSLRRSQYSDPFHGRLNFMEGNPFNPRLYGK